MSNIQKVRLHAYIYSFVQHTMNGLYTRAEIARNIEQYGVFINGTSISNRLTWVLPGDMVDISHWPRGTQNEFCDTFKLIRIMYESLQMLVVFKPPNIVVHEGAGHRNIHLLGWLQDRYPELSQLSQEYNYGLVNRLDKFTQGILLVARDKDTFLHLKSQFQARTVSKEYCTVLSGRLTDCIEVINWQARSRTNPRQQVFFANEQAALTYDRNARIAHSQFFPLVYCNRAHATLCKVVIHTGRMHQIRVQAQALGFPLVGDPVYGHTKKEPYAALSSSSATVIHIDETRWQQLLHTLFMPAPLYLLSNAISFEDQDRTRKHFYVHDIATIVQSYTQSD